MDQHRFIELQYRFEHRHKDGQLEPTWSRSRSHHDPTAHDPERVVGHPPDLPLQDLRARR